MRRKSSTGTPGLGRERGDVLADVGDAARVVVGELGPAHALVANGVRPIGAELRAQIGLEELAAGDAVAVGQAQQPAFQPDQLLVDGVELLDQRFHAVVVQPQRLELGDDGAAELVVAGALLGREIRPVEAPLDQGGLELVELHEVRGDGVQHGHDAFAQLAFHRGDGGPGAVVEVVLGGGLLLGGGLGLRGGALGGDLVVRIGPARLGLGAVGAGGGVGGGHQVGARRRGRSHARGAVDAAVGLFEVDDLAQQDAALFELVAPGHDGLEGQRGLAQAADHGVAAGLDALGDGDLAFAREQLHRAHFAQVHAHRIVGAVEGGLGAGDLDGGVGAHGHLAAFRRGGGFLALFVVLHDVDAHLREHGEGVLDLLGGELLGRQDLVQLVHGDVAAGLGRLDELLDARVRQVQQWTVGGGLGFGGLGRVRHYLLFSSRTPTGPPSQNRGRKRQAADPLHVCGIDV
jgi:hypothetical protein